MVRATREREGVGRLLVLLHLALVAVAAAGCAGWHDLQFRQDTRLSITTPKNLSTVELPITVAWRWRGAPLAPGERYAVFLDRYPMAPGKDLHSIVDTVVACKGNDDCLEHDYLRDNFNIFLTRRNEVTIDSLPPGSADTAGDGTYATIVLLDSSGRRIGESVWYVSFEVGA